MGFDCGLSGSCFPWVDGGYGGWATEGCQNQTKNQEPKEEKEKSSCDITIWFYVLQCGEVDPLFFIALISDFVLHEQGQRAMRTPRLSYWSALPSSPHIPHHDHTRE